MRALYALCRVDRNLGRLDRHPDAGASNQTELQDRGARDLGHQRDGADDPDANAFALTIATAGAFAADAPAASKPLTAQQQKMADRIRAIKENLVLAPEPAESAG